MTLLSRCLRWLKTFTLAVAVLVTWNAAIVTGHAGCPWGLGVPRQTLTQDLNQASIVLCGTLCSADETPTPQYPLGKTTLVIQSIIKKSPALPNEKELILPYYVEQGIAGQYKYLVFVDVTKNQLDPYRGIRFKSNSNLEAYLQEMLKLKSEKPPIRLKSIFNYLKNADAEVSSDAFLEFTKADYKDYADLAKQLPADRIASLLKDTRIPAHRLGLYASLLGHCGKEQHAKLLRQMFEDQGKQTHEGLEGLLTGYMLLKPKEGWPYVRSILRDPDKEFRLGHAALKTVRFLWNNRSDLFSHKELAEALAPLLEMNDTADLVIEDFRKWQYWHMTEKILALQEHPVYTGKLVQRTMLRYALSVKNKPAAQQFVNAWRVKDAELVADIEELLAMDDKPTK